MYVGVGADSSFPYMYPSTFLPATVHPAKYIVESLFNCVVEHTTLSPKYSTDNCNISVGKSPLSSKYPAIANSILLPYASILLLSAEILAFFIIDITNGVTISASIASITYKHIR